MQNCCVIGEVNMRIIGVIPARYKSSRFPGKPLADICGKPMIWWVYNQAVKVSDFDSVYVATDDERIESVCKALGMNVIMTSETHPTGTDRIGEVAEKIQADLYVNIQGDEPMLESEIIRSAILPFYKNSELQITNLMAVIDDPVDVVNFTVPKVIANKDNVGDYLTRSAAPYSKGQIDYKYYKQVCFYGFKPEALKFYCDYVKKYGKAKAEAIEDIEILRFIENGYKVQYVEVESHSADVDTQNDFKSVNNIMNKQVSKNVQITYYTIGGDTTNKRAILHKTLSLSTLVKGGRVA